MMSREVIEAGFVLALSAASGQVGSPLIQLIPFALVLGIFYFVILLPMKRRQKKVQEFLERAEGRRSRGHVGRLLRRRSRK